MQKQDNTRFNRILRKYNFNSRRPKSVKLEHLLPLSLSWEGGKTFDFPSQIQSLLRKKIEEEKKYEKVAQVFASFCNIFVKFLCK